MIKSIYREGIQIVRFLHQLVQLRLEKKYDKSIRPTILNLNIIDSCNSKCTMCNIWKRDEELEISPDELALVLSDPLYENLTHVGVTGGEPTLRDDLPEIFSTLIRILPKLKGLSIITNAIQEERVKAIVTEINSICKLNRIHFSAMVSIDGVGEAHDRVRGVKGNFLSAIGVFNYFRNDLSIPTSFGCTISKINAWDADELLFYAKKYNLYGRFRIAETINRLYNQNRGKVIRSFDDDETYNLLIFFEKLKISFEKNAMYNRTYTNIQNMMQGSLRLTGCPYHKNGIVLGSKGQINYCAPQASDLGSGLIQSSSRIYKDNFTLKREIIENKCSTCIHDYHAPINFREKLLEIRSYYCRKVLSLDSERKVLFLSKFIKKVPRKKNYYRVFIIGWYGTETVGDKAILGGIVDDFKNRFGTKIEFVIGSLYPFISERTCKELNIDAKVVSTKSFDLIRYAKSSDEIVMGGGPLMDSADLYVPYLGFLIARKNHINTSIFGCGIGPLYKPKFENVVRKILQLSTKIMLRDKGSINTVNKYGFKDVILSGDFAQKYLQSRIDQYQNLEAPEGICCYLRDWTYEYSRDISYDDFIIKKRKFEKGLANFIIRKAKSMNGSKIRFKHMHNFVVGNDDRDFSRYFVSEYFSDEKDLDVTIDFKLSTVDSIISSMLSSKLNVCMRFHSVLFAHTLDTDFVAIDYTKGGKIMNYLEDNLRLESLVKIDELLEL